MKIRFYITLIFGPGERLSYSYFLFLLRMEDIKILQGNKKHKNSRRTSGSDENFA